MPSSDPTNAARQRRWYQRQKDGTSWVPLTCEACGGNVRGTHGALCSRCWEHRAPEGRAAKAERVRRSRANRRSA
jgi:hypothetical protein